MLTKLPFTAIILHFLFELFIKFFWLFRTFLEFVENSVRTVGFYGKFYIENYYLDICFELFYRFGKPKFAHFPENTQKPKNCCFSEKLVPFVFELTRLLKWFKKSILIVIFDVKFPVESNRPSRIFGKREENPENDGLNKI